MPDPEKLTQTIKHNMHVFSEVRWKASLPFFLIICIQSLALVMPFFYKKTALLHSIWLSLLVVAFFFLKRLFIKREVIWIDDSTLKMTGVIPTYWGLFQRWHTVEIRSADIVSIFVGKGMKLMGTGRIIGPLGEPSRGGGLQNFIWVKYENAVSAQEIYYPHFNDIKNWEKLLVLLEQKYGDRLQKFL